MAEPTAPAPSDGDFLKILLVGMDKRADRIEGRLAGIEGTQSEILRLQIGQGRDLSAHLATPHAPVDPAPHVDAAPEIAKPDGNGVTDAKVERALERLVLKWLWENKKAAALALAFIGAGGAGGFTIKGCSGQPVTISRAADSATATPLPERASRNPRSRPDAFPE